MHCAQKSQRSGPQSESNKNQLIFVCRLNKISIKLIVARMPIDALYMLRAAQKFKPNFNN